MKLTGDWRLSASKNIASLECNKRRLRIIRGVSSYWKKLAVTVKFLPPYETHISYSLILGLDLEMALCAVYFKTHTPCVADKLTCSIWGVGILPVMAKWYMNRDLMQVNRRITGNDVAWCITNGAGLFNLYCKYWE